MKKALIIIFLYFLTVLQTSFLVHFSILGIIPNFVLIAVVIINICENEKNYFGLFAAALGGLFLDIFSSQLMGFNILILLAIAVFIKLFFKKHVRIPFLEKI